MRTTLIIVWVTAGAVGAASGCGDGGGAALPTSDAADASGEPTADAVDDAAGPDPAELAALVLGVSETGAWTLAGLEGEVHVLRTAGDVPHLYASSRHDLMLAHGFVMALDRYFSFEVVHRLARGRVSSLLGELALTIDVDFRTQGLPEVARGIFEHLDAEGGALLDAYAAGINAWVDAARAGEVPLPSELIAFAPLLGVEDPSEVLEHVGREEVAGFAAFAVWSSSHGSEDLVRAAAAAQLDGHFAGAALEGLRQAGLAQDIVRPVSPVHMVSSTVFPDDAGDAGTRAGALSSGRAQTLPLPIARSLPGGMIGRLQTRHDRHDRLLGRGAGGDHGSNVWAVSGAVTDDGATYLAGDGHLALGVPPYFMQIGLDTTVFGGDTLRASGLVLPGFPLLAVGTNGRIAWSQTYPRADTTDWYREELRLGDDGLPADSRFQGEWVPLVRVDETYEVAPVLGDGGAVVIPRWETFDGRLIVDVEGLAPASDEAPVVRTGDGPITPADTDGDGVIVALSTDYTGYDVGNMLASVLGFLESDDVHAFREHVRGHVGYAQNLIAADVHGGIQYTGYTATPCRGYLPRDAGGEWVAGASPLQVLDGTLYGGFEVVLGDDGVPLHEGDDAAPQRCVVPWVDFPGSVDPARGYLLNANNDPGDGTFDGSLADDPWYIGGPWTPGFRAHRIDAVLGEQAAAGTASTASMAALQADHVSGVGQLFAPMLLEAVAHGEATLPAEQLPRLAEVGARIQAWLDAGARAESGVETFYHQPTAQDRDDAAATMIFNAWFRRWRAAVLDDEQIGPAFLPASMGRTVVTRTLYWLITGRGPDNPRGLASWNPQTQESAFFDVLGTPEIETSQQVALDALVTALAELEGPKSGPAAGGFETADMSQWLWGLRHQLLLESILLELAGDVPLLPLLVEEFAIDTALLPLADDLAAGDPRKGLRWFPRPGDLFGVDAANPAFDGPDYHYATGPIMRMVVRLHPDGVSGLNVVPGGQSGIAGAPHYADQAALYLANQALPLLLEVEDVVAAASGRQVLRPAE